MEVHVHASGPLTEEQIEQEVIACKILRDSQPWHIRLRYEFLDKRYEHFLRKGEPMTDARLDAVANYTFLVGMGVGTCLAMGLFLLGSGFVGFALMTNALAGIVAAILWGVVMVGAFRTTRPKVLAGLRWLGAKIKRKKEAR